MITQSLNREDEGKGLSVKSERGIALIVALVMLALLSMAGTLAITTATTELRIVGNYRNQQVAYYNADRVEEFGPNNPVVHAPFDIGLTSYPTGTGVQIFTPPPGMSGQTEVRVELQCIGPNPQGTPTESGGDIGSGTKPGLVHYLVILTGRGPNNAEYVVESEVTEPRSVPSALDFDC